ncbi:MAG: uracil-DNA glycosylase family protein [bacterium]
MPDYGTVLDLTRSYLRQQAELFGSRIYLKEAVEYLAEEEADLHNLDQFFSQIKDCTKCKLSKSRTKFVFGVGSPNAKLICVGEGPGYDEDQQGEPFVGPAGKLLTKILNAIGFDRSEVYIANVVKCRPPGNREPEPEEIAECLPYVRRQIEMIAPAFILALGRVASQNLLGVHTAVGKLRGTVHRLGNVDVIVTYHPAALLRNPELKRSTWEDVQQLRRLYDEKVGDKVPMDFDRNKA